MININGNYVGKVKSRSYSDEVQNFKLLVASDGGIVANPSYLNKRIAHAKENNYYDNISVWYGADFAYKIANGFVSTIYDVINPTGNSLVQTTASRRPLLIPKDSTLNNKPSFLSDGIDDLMLTSHKNTIVPANSQIFFILVFKSLENKGSDDSSKNWFVADKSELLTPSIGVRENTSESYRSSNFKRLDTSGGTTFGYFDPSGPGSQAQLNKWHILAHSINSDSYYIWNGSKSRTGIAYKDLATFSNIQGITMFGRFASTDAGTLATLKNCYIAECMLIQGSVDDDLGESIRDIINDHYNIV